MLTKEHVAAAEQSLGKKLPAALVQRLMVKNGEYLTRFGQYWRVLPIADVSDRRAMLRTFEDVVRETTSAREFKSLPGDAVVIATSDSGDRLVLREDPSDSSRFGVAVYLWSIPDARYELLADHLFELWETGE